MPCLRSEQGAGNKNTVPYCCWGSKVCVNVEHGRDGVLWMKDQAKILTKPQNGSIICFPDSGVERLDYFSKSFRGEPESDQLSPLQTYLIF